jgi:hypothetical protein
MYDSTAWQSQEQHVLYNMMIADAAGLLCTVLYALCKYELSGQAASSCFGVCAAKRRATDAAVLLCSYNEYNDTRCSVTPHRVFAVRHSAWC